MDIEKAKPLQATIRIMPVSGVGQTFLSAGIGGFLAANAKGHNIQFQGPELIVSFIRQMVESARTNRAEPHQPKTAGPRSANLTERAQRNRIEVLVLDALVAWAGLR